MLDHTGAIHFLLEISMIYNKIFFCTIYMVSIARLPAKLNIPPQAISLKKTGTDIVNTDDTKTIKHSFNTKNP